MTNTNTFCLISISNLKTGRFETGRFETWRFVNLTFWNRTFWNQTFWNLTFWNLTFCGCTSLSPCSTEKVLSCTKNRWQEFGVWRQLDEQKKEVGGNVYNYRASAANWVNSCSAPPPPLLWGEISLWLWVLEWLQECARYCTEGCDVGNDGVISPFYGCLKSI